MTRSSFARAIIGIIVVIVLSAGTSWVIIEAATDESGLELGVPQLTAQDRETVQLELVTLVPSISGQGTVTEADNGFIFRAAISPAELAYRLMDPPAGVQVTLYGGPGGFECDWIGIERASQGMSMSCSIPDDVRVVDGLAGTMVLYMEPPQDAVGLPTSAVLGAADTGQVIVIHDDGTTEAREVKLGHSDMQAVEILDGLEEGDSVLRFPVQSDFEQADR